jgi:hypothetical protein
MVLGHALKKYRRLLGFQIVRKNDKVKLPSEGILLPVNEG